MGSSIFAKGCKARVGEFVHFWTKCRAIWGGITTKYNNCLRTTRDSPPFRGGIGSYAIVCTDIFCIWTNIGYVVAILQNDYFWFSRFGVFWQF
jgi:hypothetical protein